MLTEGEITFPIFYVDNGLACFSTYTISSAIIKKAMNTFNSRLEEKYICNGCKIISLKLKICTGCNKVLYCSRECQKKDWKEHKKICKKDWKEHKKIYKKS